MTAFETPEAKKDNKEKSTPGRGDARKTENEGMLFINNLESIICKDAGPKNLGKFMDELGSKFPISLGDDFKSEDKEGKKVMLIDISGGQKVFDLYNQSRHYIINDDSIIFYYKTGGSTLHYLDVSHEGLPKKPKRQKKKNSETTNLRGNEMNEDEMNDLPDDLRIEAANAEKTDILEDKLSNLESLQNPDAVARTLNGIMNFSEEELKEWSDVLAERATLLLNAHVTEGQLDIDEDTLESLEKNTDLLKVMVGKKFRGSKSLTPLEIESIRKITETFLIQ